MRITTVLVLVVWFVSLATVSRSVRMMAGGFTEWRVPSAEEEAICKKFEPEVLKAVNKKCNQEFTEYDIISVRSQVVAGTNYQFKINIGSGREIVIKVFKSLPHAGSTLELTHIDLPSGSC